jgi:hypothetical protein
MKNSDKVGAAAGAGTVGAIGTTLVGASAAEISVILASAGAVLGGGMVAGVAVFAAAPLAVFGAVKGIASLFD